MGSFWLRNPKKYNIYLLFITFIVLCVLENNCVFLGNSTMPVVELYDGNVNTYKYNYFSSSITYFNKFWFIFLQKHAIVT